MYIEPPITVAQFYEGAVQRGRLPENEPQRHPKPRVSSMSRDARAITYKMANTPIVTPSRGDLTLSAEKGRMMEDVSIEALEERGLYVVNRQIQLPDSYPFTGHPDGELSTAGDGRTTLMPDGKKWGFEHKHFGRWAYENIMKKGLVAASPEIIGQIALYGDALGWDACMVVVTAQDASSVRSDMTRNSKAKNPAARWADTTEADPKVMIFGIDIKEAAFTIVPMLKLRAQWFMRWYEEDGNPNNVMWENEPGKYWSWDYSEWGDLAKASSQGFKQAPQLPWEG